jgi:hypothetical protein
MYNLARHHLTEAAQFGGLAGLRIGEIWLNNTPKAQTRNFARRVDKSLMFWRRFVLIVA